ncbi:MAG: hypothetical protein JNK06_07315 [Candidatus Accumulibacter phosphatis]|uniref:hypothetical protein n=1 Tax=Candidatus Accumulibacter phosphatis TaxID=327160 RepID=UPI001A5E9972|nr:hypothetical protein [Candidatus Accumulibacter phosphatis]
MKSARPQTTETSARDKADYTGAADSLADSIKSRLQAGEIVAATDYSESDRALFWGAIALVRDELPAVKPTWRTISEEHLDGLRTRQKRFRISPREKGIIDSTLAGLLALAVSIAVLLLAGGLPV